MDAFTLSLYIFKDPPGILEVPEGLGHTTVEATGFSLALAGFSRLKPDELMSWVGLGL